MTHTGHPFIRTPEAAGFYPPFFPAASLVFKSNGNTAYRIIPGPNRIMDLPFHPSLLPTLCLAAISVAVAAVMRRFVRKENTSLLPWLTLWGTLCTIPALMFASLCLPGFGGAADWLNESIAGTRIEVLAGIAGVLPGLLWDDAAERMERNRPPLFGLSEPRLRALMIAALTIILLIPYGFLFNRQTSHAPLQEATAPVQTETVPASPAAD